LPQAVLRVLVLTE